MAATTSTTITKNNRSSQVGMNNGSKKPLSIGQILDTFKVTRGQPHTHTAFGYGVTGLFYVPPNATCQFTESYKSHVENGQDVCITEKHRDISPVLVDLDFKQDGPDRLYTKDEVVKFVEIYNDVITQYVVVENPRYFVLEKPSPRQAKNGDFKDGIHVVCPDVVTRPDIQYLVREKVLAR